MGLKANRKLSARWRRQGWDRTGRIVWRDARRRRCHNDFPAGGHCRSPVDRTSNSGVCSATTNIRHGRINIAIGRIGIRFQ